MKQGGILLFLIIALGAGLFFWQSKRDPWASLTAPQGFAFGALAVVDVETGDPFAVEDLDGLGRQLITQLSQSFTDITADGYGLYDPSTKRFTVALSGRLASTTADLTGERVSFDTKNSGGEPLFAEFDPHALSVVLLAPADGFLSEIALKVPMTPTDVTAQIAFQDKLAAETAAKLAEWRATITAFDLSAPSGSDLPADFYEMTLPGSEVTLAMPLWAHPGPDIYRFGDVRIKPAGAVEELITIRPWPKETAKEIVAEERERLLAAPKDELVVISDTASELILARYGQPVVLLAHKQTEHIAYSVYGTAKTPEELAQMRLIANSFTPTAPRPPAVFDAPEFDAYAWYADTYAPLSPELQGFDSPQELIARLFVRENYMSRRAGKMGYTLILKRTTDAWPEHSIRIACRLEQQSPADLADWHATAGNALVEPIFNYADELAAARNHVQSGAFAKEAPWPGTSEFFDAEMAPIQWFTKTKTRAIGQNGHHFFGYQTRDIAGNVLICGMGTTHPVALVIALDSISALELPDIQPPDEALISQFRAYHDVRPLLPDTYEVNQSFEEASTIVDANGRELIGPGFERFWAYRESGVFSARQSGTENEALFAADGRKLLPPQYEDFQEKEPGLISVRARGGGDWLLYSVEKETFVDRE